MRIAALTIAAAFLSGTIAGAQPIRDTRHAAGGTATLSGTIVSDEPEPHPVRQARVTCSAAEISEGLTAVTDDRGRFTCANLPAGRYSVAVSRDGWVPAAYGAKRPLRPGTPVPIADGQHADIVIRMLRGAVITGTLVDESGQPATGATVVALRSSMLSGLSGQTGERRLAATGMAAVADDRGVYRIFGLPPGDYYVGAGPSGTALSVTEAQITSGTDVRHVAFASTYYPGTATALQAAPISLGASEERTEIDFALQLVPTARIEGSVTMPDGTPAPPSAQITIVASGPAAFAGSAFDGVKTTRPGGDGTFAFSGVAPGTYTLLARVATPSVSWASTQVTVDGNPISGLILALQPGLSIAGQIRIDGSGARPPFALAAIRVAAEPVQAPGEISAAPTPVTADAEGRFVVGGVTPGRYRLVATLPAAARAAGWVQESGAIGGVETLDAPAAIVGPSIADAVVTLTDRPGHLAGVLPSTADGRPSDYTLVLFPADPALRVPRTRRIQAVRAAADGAYSFDALAPGDYLLASVDDVEPGEWFDPAFLARLAPAAVRVSVRAGVAGR